MFLDQPPTQFGWNSYPLAKCCSHSGTRTRVERPTRKITDDDGLRGWTHVISNSQACPYLTTILFDADILTNVLLFLVLEINCFLQLKKRLRGLCLFDYLHYLWLCTEHFSHFLVIPVFFLALFKTKMMHLRW